MVFRLFESYTDRIHNFTIKRREQGVFLYWKPLKEENVGDEQPTFVVQNNFFSQKILTRDVSFKKLLNSVCKAKRETIRVIK